MQLTPFDNKICIRDESGRAVGIVVKEGDAGVLELKRGGAPTYVDYAQILELMGKVAVDKEEYLQFDKSKSASVK